jgi:hypothetical protein
MNAFQTTYTEISYKPANIHICITNKLHRNKITNIYIAYRHTSEGKDIAKITSSSIQTPRSTDIILTKFTIYLQPPGHVVQQQ